MKTLSSQNQTEIEIQTSFQFNGKEGICSETCEKFLTRSRRNAAPATAKKERFYHSLDQSEFNDQVDQSEAQIRDEIVRRRMMDLVITKILNFRPKNLVVKLVSILKVIPCPKI